MNWTKSIYKSLRSRPYDYVRFTKSGMEVDLEKYLRTPSGQAFIRPKDYKKKINMKIINVTTYNVLEKTTVGKVLKILSDSGGNTKCMHNLKYKESIDSELKEFYDTWSYLKSLPQGKEIIIIDGVEKETYLS